jgi:aspartate/methionine/tyrosine aminotransferase
MNPSVVAIPGSIIRQIASKKRATSIDLGLGEPTLLPSIEHFEYAMQRTAREGVKYTANAGDRELRAAIAGYYAYPQMSGAENVCITAGSQEAMYVTLMTLLDPAFDELLVVEPAFPSYVKMATLGGVAVRTVSMLEDDGFAFDAERILAGIGAATRAIVLCSPCNPTSRVLRRDQAELLVETLRRREGTPIWLIHDEIYREQCFVDDAADLARMYPYTVVTNSLSKSNALTGLRLGWILGPGDFIEQAVKAHAWVTSCADTFAQYVAMHIFSGSDGVREHAEWYARQQATVVAALRESGLPYVVPDGAFYACVGLPPGVDSLSASLALIDRHDVVAIPGRAFGAAMEGWLRCSWVAPADVVAEGFRRIADWSRATAASGSGSSIA